MLSRLQLSESLALLSHVRPVFFGQHFLADVQTACTFLHRFLFLRRLRFFASEGEPRPSSAAAPAMRPMTT